MPPNRTSRPRHIPENLLVNWRPSDLRDGAKPRLRRPVTACDACRNAKAKCSGKQGCDRCATRGLVCAYNSQAAADHCPPRGDSVQTPSMQATWPVRDIAEGVHAVAPHGSTAGQDSASSAGHQPSADLESVTPADWTSGLQHQSIHPVNCQWDPIDFTLENQAFRPTAHSNALGNDTSHWQCLANAIPQTSPQEGCNPLRGDKTQGASSTASESSTSFGLQSHQVPSPNCLCRPNLMFCLPKITDAMQDKRLDEVFKVMGDLTKRCQEVMDCQTTQVSCTDLLLVVTALQEIHPCFNYIAKSDLGSAVQVSFGGYEVSLSDGNLRAMLVMDLVQRANTVLTTVSSKGQTMINELGELSCLAMANIAYLEATISHLKTILRCTASYIEEGSYNGGSAFGKPPHTSTSTLI